MLQESISFAIHDQMTQEEKLKMAMENKDNQDKEITIDLPQDPAKEFYQTMHQEVLLRGLSPKSRMRA